MGLDYSFPLFRGWRIAAVRGGGGGGGIQVDLGYSKAEDGWRLGVIFLYF